MRYVALVHADERRWDALPDGERQAIYARYRSFAAEARAAGKLVDGDELQPTSTATTVRVKDGETLVTDGPFAELREQLGGYFVLECESLDEAVALASRIPAVEHGAAVPGAVEVRPAYVDEEAP
jgi:hypothetical protein